MFLGKFEHTLDEKQRLTIPAKLRNKISGTIYVSGGVDKCLQIRTESSFNDLLEELNSKSNMDEKARLIKRHILSNSAEIEIDSIGRINIPSNILESANIEKKVYLIGQGDYIEIWNNDIYDQYLKSNEENIIEFANKLGA